MRRSVVLSLAAALVILAGIGGIPAREGLFVVGGDERTLRPA